MTKPEDQNDDAHWLELLAGRPAPDARPSCRVEASWLRAAMLSVRSAVPAGDVLDPEARLQTLLAKAKAAGLRGVGERVSADLGAAPSKRNARPWGQRLSQFADAVFRSPVSWATSAVLALGVFLVLPQGHEPSEAILRGQAVQQLVSADPQALQRKVAAELRTQGFDVATFDRLGRPGLELTLPEQPTADQVAQLRGLGLEWPAGPQLVVEFVQTSGTATP